MSNSVNLPVQQAGSIVTAANVASLPPSASEGDVRWVEDINALYIYRDGAWAASGGGGGVAGPVTSTDNAVARYDGATGQVLQNSAVTIDDSGNIATAGTVDGRDVSSDGTTLDNHVASTAAHGATGAVVGTTNTQTLTNKTIDADLNPLSNIANAQIKAGAAIDAAKIADGSVSSTEFQFLDGVTSAIQTQLNAKASSTDLTTHTGASVAHGVTSNIVGVDDTQTLTNKTLIDGTTRIEDVGDPTMALVFDVGGATGTTTTLATSQLASCLIVLPDTSTTLVGIDTTDTLTNKTLTSPTINTPTGIVKGDVGLGNVDNTSDATKNAASVTLTNKTLTSPAINSPTGIVKGDVGLGSVDNTSDATKNAATVTLTNKTLTSPILTAPAVSDYVDFTQTTTPTNPAATHDRLYFKSNDKLYKLNSAGLESEVGSGSGEKNYILDQNAVGVGWVASGAGVTVVSTTTGSELPEESKGSGIKITPVSGTTDFARYRFTLDDSDKSKKLKIQFALKSLSSYAAADLVIEMHTNTASNYAGTDATLVVANPSIPATLSAGGTVYQTSFDSDISDYYELRIRRAAGTSAIVISGVVVGPGVIVQGAAVSGPIKFTPSSPNSSLGTISSHDMYYTRDGSRMLIQGTVATGTMTGTEARLSLPFGTLSGPAAITVVGYFHTNNNTNNQAKRGSVLALSGLKYLNFSTDEYVGTTYPTVAQNANVAFPIDNRNIHINASIEIAEWAGSGTVLLGPGPDVEYVSNSSVAAASNDTASFKSGPDGNLIGSVTATILRRVKFQYPIQPTDEIRLEVDVDGVGSWLRAADSQIGGVHRQHVVTSGLTWIRVSGSSTELDFVVYTYADLFNNTTFGNPGRAWSSFPNARWRMVKVKAGAAVGFGLATTIQTGLVFLANSEIRMSGTNGMGGSSSGHTFIQNYRDTLVSVGTGITYVPRTTNAADYFYINEAGIYAISCSIYNASVNYFGITKNCDLPSSNISANADDRILIMSLTHTGGDAQSIATTARLAVGDAIRAHGGVARGVGSSVADKNSRFAITQLSRL